MDIGVFLIENELQNVIENGDLRADTTLETAVLISLFTDKRIKESPDDSSLFSRRGYWGDTLSKNNDQIGSELWLLDRAKVNSEALVTAETKATEALQWMIDDGVADSVQVSASFDSKQRLNLAIEITRPTGEKNRYDYAWKEQELIRG